MNWDKVETRIWANGERTVAYQFLDMRIESRRRLIPHVGREGGWLNTTYFLIWPDGYEEDYRTLREAKEAGEKELERRGY